MSLIEKIEAEIAKASSYEFNTDTRKAYRSGLNKAKEFILSEQLTIGDKIRESNESLAEFIKTVTDKCIIGSCSTCPIYKACDQMENKEDLVNYLNQPYTE